MDFSAGHSIQKLDFTANRIPTTWWCYRKANNVIATLWATFGSEVFRNTALEVENGKFNCIWEYYGKINCWEYLYYLLTLFPLLLLPDVLAFRFSVQ